MPAPAAPAPLLGRMVAGRYRLLQLLGSGGLGDVYLAEAVALPGGRREPRGRVAVKVLREEHRSRRELVARFRREAEAAARVRHENVVEILEPPSAQGDIHCFVTELLIGLDLADTLAYEGALSPPRAVRIAAGAAEGLAAAHALGVVHRDVKPENIFLVHAADGREAVKILDFGVAYLPGDPRGPVMSSVGTPGYMAPEQAEGAPADPRADVYSLGVVLHEMLTGHLDDGAPSAPRPRVRAERRAAHASAPPPARPSPALDAVVARALARDPAVRFASTLELAFALLAVPEAG